MHIPPPHTKALSREQLLDFRPYLWLDCRAFLIPARVGNLRLGNQERLGNIRKLECGAIKKRRKWACFCKCLTGRIAWKRSTELNMVSVCVYVYLYSYLYMIPGISNEKGPGWLEDGVQFILLIIANTCFTLPMSQRCVGHLIYSNSLNYHNNCLW